MTRHAAQPRRDLARRRSSDVRSQTIAASALAGGFLTVVALWKTASGAATTGIAVR